MRSRARPAVMSLPSPTSTTSAAPRLSVLFVNHESWHELAGALLSLARHPPPVAWELIVVDNASRSHAGRERAEALLRELGGRLLARADNPGYGAGMNRALAEARGELLLACNPDLVFQAGCIAALVRHLDEQPRSAVAAPEVYLDRALTVRAPAHVLPTPLDLVQSTLAALWPGWNRRYLAARTRAAVREWERSEPFEQAMFGGCCFLIRRALVEELGFFDERYPLYFEDTDLARRVRAAGHALVQVPSARVVHLYGRSSAQASEHAAAAYVRSRRIYFRRWYGAAGATIVAALERALSTGFARRRAARMLARDMPPLDDATLHLREPCARFLVELCNDPLFLLAAGAFGSGASWRLDPLLVAELRRPLWLRAIDVAAGRARELGRWRHDPRPGFNRLLRSFAEERADPRHAAEQRALAELVAELAALGVRVRLDAQREWEHAHVALALSELGAAMRVLDLGGGNGPLAYRFARRGYRVTMLDADREAVAGTLAGAHRLGLAGLEAVHAPRPPWPLAAESFDVVTCVSVIEGVLRKDRTALWREIRRVLRPGGTLFLTFDFGPDARFVGDPPLSLEEIERDLVAASGLELVGEPIRLPEFGADGPPVRAEALGADGRPRAIAYTFGALRLVKPG